MKHGETVSYSDKLISIVFLEIQILATYSIDINGYAQYLMFRVIVSALPKDGFFTFSTSGNIFMLGLFNQLRLVRRSPPSNNIIFNLWKYVSKMFNGRSISMKASVAKDTDFFILGILDY